MTNQPTADSTSIETATVQIRTLNVGAKQMTQGIFRQLLTEQTISTSGHVRGTPWGIVNYHPDRCEDAKEHLHVVWQSGAELRRAYVSAPEFAYLRHPLVGEYVTALVFEGVRRAVGRVGHGSLRITRASMTQEISATVMASGVMFQGSTVPSALAAWDDTSGYEKPVDRLPADFEAAYGRPLRPSVEVKELLPIDAYRTAWRQMSALPQLFIGR
ncbi:hypothetical protein ABZ439_11450 [Streptomyces sp. NPDC005840]|uniref:hypothetical protein n=1 Tax=Streptomyces sp. NPDC005840 TaxID=3157072 RepID=UPI0033DB74A3